LDFKNEEDKNKKKIPVNDNDEVFKKIRHKNFHSSGKLLQEEAKDIKVEYEKKE